MICVTNSFSSLTHAYHAFLLLFFIYDWHAFTIRQTCLLHMFTLFLPYALHVFASRLTPFLYIFKPVVRWLLFTKNSNVLTPELLDLRQYLAIGTLCYKLFFFFNMRLPCLLLFFSLTIDMHFTQGWHTFYTCSPHFYFMFYMCLPQGKHLSLTYLSQ